MMKSRKALILTSAVVCCAAFGAGVLTACSNKAGGKEHYDSGDEYDWAYTPSNAELPDDDMKIDGVIDEARWSGKKWLTHSDRNVDMRYTTAFTEKGLYVAAEAVDSKMQWNDSRSYNNNSSFFFYVASNRAVKYSPMLCFNFFVDELHTSCPQQARYMAKAVKTEDENGKPKLTAEMFVTWEQIKYDVDEQTGMPDKVYLSPAYRYVEGFASMDNAYLHPLFTEMETDRVRNTPQFDGSGYMHVDDEKSDLGNMKSGFAKTDGWDFDGILGDENGENKVLKVAQGGNQAIYFRNISSSRYTYKVDIKPKGNIDDGNTAVGVVDARDTIDCNIMYFRYNEFESSGKKEINCFFRENHSFIGNMFLHGATNQEASDTVTVRVIKDGTRLYYIFNENNLFIVKDIDWLGGDTTPGFVSLGCDAEFSNWEAVDYAGADKDDAFEALCAEYMNVIKVDENISGGSVTADKLSTPKGSSEKVTLKINPASGYMLTDLTVNGQSVYNDIIGRLADGTVTLDVNGAMRIGAVFTPMALNKTIRIVGNVKRSTGASLIGLPYILSCADEGHENLIYASDVTTAGGMFDISVLKAGDYSIGGKDVTLSGKYKIKFIGTFPSDENSEFIIDTTTIENIDNTSFCNWHDIVINPYKVAQMKINDDGNIQTTNLKYSGTASPSYYLQNELLSGTSFRLDTEVHANNDRWPCYGITVEDEQENSVQFFAAGVNIYRLMQNYDGLFNQVAKGGCYYDENGEKIARLTLIYDKNADTFSFYVNGVLFDTVNKSKYLTGNTFRFGAVGWMVGADGSFVDVSDENPYAFFTPFEVTKTYKVTVPDGVKILLNGNEIDGNAVPICSTVKFEIPTTDETYMYVVNGMPILTEFLDGKATAMHTVTEDLNVEFLRTYTVSGIVSGGSAEEITIATDAGVVLYSGSGTSFTAHLPNGSYTATAYNSEKVSRAVKFTVDNANVTNIAIALDRPHIKAVPGINRFGEYATYRYEMKFDPATGAYVAYNNDSRCNGGYIDGVQSGEQFAVTATVGKFTGNWPAAGFIVEAEDGFTKFTLRYNIDKLCYDSVRVDTKAGHWSIFDLPTSLNQPFANGDTAELGLVYSGGRFYFIINGEVAYTIDDYVTPKLGGKVGVFAELEVSFLDWKYTETRIDLEQYIGRTIAISGENLSVKVGDTSITDGGKALLGDTVTVTVGNTAGKQIGILVNGNAVKTVNENGTATATFTLTDNVTVSYSEMFTVSGHTAAGATVVIATPDGKIYDELTAAQNGSYSISLTAGTYYFVAYTASDISRAVQVTVVNGNVTVDELTPNRPRVLEWNKLVNHVPFTFDYKTGNYNGINGAWPFYVGGYIAGSEITDAFVITATVDKFDTADSSAGFIIESAHDNGTGRSSVRFTLRRKGDNNFDLLLENNDSKWGWADESFGMNSDCKAPFKNGDTAEIACAYYKGAYYFFVNGILASKITGYSAPVVGGNVGIFAEIDATFTAWGYSSDAKTVDSYLGASVSIPSGVTAKIGDKTIENNGYAYLGDTVTFSTPVQAGKKIGIVVNGTPIATTINDGVISGSYVVNARGVITVTLSEQYVVAGTTTAGATVTVASSDGEVLKTQTATNGSFTFDLTGGATYYITAETDALISTPVKIELASQGQSGIVVTPDKLRVASVLNKEGANLALLEFNYATGEYYAVNEPVWQGADFAKVSGNMFVASTSITARAGSYPSEGVAVTGADGKAIYFMIWGDGTPSKLQIYSRGIEGTSAIDIFDDLVDTQLPIAMKAVFANGKIFVLLNGKTVKQFDNPLTGELKIGLIAERVASFADWGYSTDRAEIEKYIGATLTLDDGITATVNGAPWTSGTKLLLGDSVTVTKSVAAGEDIALLINGSAVEATASNGAISYTFTVGGDTAVTFSTKYTLSGTTSNGATVHIVNASGENAVDPISVTNGTWSVSLAGNAVYYVTAETEDTVSAVVKVELASAAQSGIVVTPDRKKLLDWSTEIKSHSEYANYQYKLIYDYAQGAYINEPNGVIESGGYIAGATIPNGGFIVSETVKKFTGANDKAGFYIQVAENEYLKMAIEYADGKYRGWRVGANHLNSGAHWGEVGFIPDVPQPFASKDTAEFTLVFLNNQYYFYIDGTLVFDFTAGGNYLAPFAGGKIGLHAEHVITFTDWSYTTERADLLEYANLTKTLTLQDGITATVNGTPWTNGTKLLLGDSVTVTKTVAAGEDIAMLVNDNEVTTTTTGGTISYIFTIAGDTSVTYSTKYTVNGTITGGNADKIFVYGANGNKMLETSGTSFSYSFPAGRYYAAAHNGTAASQRVYFTVSESGPNTVAVAMQAYTPAASGSLPVMTYDSVTGYYKPTVESAVMLQDVNVSAGSSWVFETTVADLARAADDDHKTHVSIMLGSAWDSYLRFTLFRRPSDTNAHVIEVMGNGGQAKWLWRDNPIYFGDDFNGDCKMALVCTGGKYYLFLNGVLEAEATIDITQRTSVSGDVKVGVYSGQSITVKDWNYSTDISNYHIA